MDVSTLSADTARRFRAVSDLLVKQAKSIDVANPSLLDVGGYPGTFGRAFMAARPRWRATTLDKVTDNLPDYVCASGAKIPFPDASFTAVVSIDTFEHIPEGNRRAFIDEVCRVSGDLVILAAPFHHPSTAAVEKTLSMVHEAVFRAPHPWLDEHVRFGLPDIDRVVASWPESHGIVEVVGSYDLGEWLHWQAMSLMNKLKGETDNVWKALEQAWANVPAPPPMVPYRWLIAARRGAKRFDPLGPLVAPAEWGGEHVETARFHARLLQCMAADGRQVAADEATVLVEERLKAAIAANESELKRLAGPGAPTAHRPDSPSALQRVSGILKRLGR